METVEKLKEEVELLTELSNDLAFAESVIQDAKQLIQIKNSSIMDLGGVPAVVDDVVEEVAEETVSQTDVAEKFRVKIDTFSRLFQMKTGVSYEEYLKNKDNKKIQKALKETVVQTLRAKIDTLSKLFQMKIGISYQQYQQNGKKYLLGGAMTSKNNIVIQKLINKAQFSFIKNCDDDAVLKYKAPANSALYGVYVQGHGQNYAVVYPMGNNVVVDFYADEDLKDSIGAVYTFSETNDNSLFDAEYDEMMKSVSDKLKIKYSGVF